MHKINKRDNNINIVRCKIMNLKKITLNKGMKLRYLSQDFIIQKSRSDKKTKQTKILYQKKNNLDIEEVRKLREKEISAADFDLQHLDNVTKQKFLKLLLTKKNTHFPNLTKC